MSDAIALPRIANGIYPERRDKQQTSLDRFGTRLIESLKLTGSGKTSFNSVQCAIEHAGQQYCDMTEMQLDAVIKELRFQLRRQGLRTELVGQSFALIREIAGRCMNMRHHDCQLKGGWILLQGMEV